MSDEGGLMGNVGMSKREFLLCGFKDLIVKSGKPTCFCVVAVIVVLTWRQWRCE